MVVVFGDRAYQIGPQHLNLGGHSKVHNKDFHQNTVNIPIKQIL